MIAFLFKKFSLKISFILIIIYIITNYFFKIKIVSFRIKYRYLSKKNLINYQKNKKNYSLIYKEKKGLLSFLSKSTGKNIKKVKSIFIDNKARFGNQFIIFNKIIFYCEILGCKKIILNKKYFWYIKNRIYDKKYKIIIEPKNFDNKEFITIIDSTFSFFHYSNIFRSEFRIDLLKREIIRNLPKLNIKININDLFMYIRSGDIFIKKKPCIYYSQPPLCFYQKILLNYKFNKIYLISENKKNPVINKLLYYFPNIIFNINNMKLDMIYLINSYNIVGTKSTFLKSLIDLNSNLKILYEYDLDFNDQFDQDFNTFTYFIKDFIIFKMKSSLIYKNRMKIWKNTYDQINLMLKYKCPYDFLIIYNKQR